MTFIQTTPASSHILRWWMGCSSTSSAWIEPKKQNTCRPKKAIHERRGTLKNWGQGSHPPLLGVLFHPLRGAAKLELGEAFVRVYGMDAYLSSDYFTVVICCIFAVYRGWKFLSSYIGIIKTHYKDPVIDQPRFHVTCHCWVLINAHLVPNVFFCFFRGAYPSYDHYLEDHPRTCKWLIIMVIVSPLSAVVSLPKWPFHGL